MLTALIFIIVIGVLVFVHELGHFVMAKRAGMRVEEFGFGFPPRIFGVKKGETVYSLNWIPFGGFVKIFGESGEDADNPRSFASKLAGARSKVIIAGVVMNILFAVLLLSIGNIFGLRTGLSQGEIGGVKDLKVQIISVSPGSPAAIAGLEPLDEITGFKEAEKIINAENVKDSQIYIQNNLGKEIALVINRSGEIIEKKLIPRADPPAGEGAIGISLASTGIIKYPWYESVYRGVVQTGILTAATVVGYTTIIKNIFVNGGPGADLSGPIGIAVITGKAASFGFTYLLQFTALISINLAVLNIIPFPALDGGRLFFVGIEKLKGSPVSRRIEGLVNAAGFALLILLMIYVTTKDIAKFF